MASRVSDMEANLGLVEEAVAHDEANAEQLGLMMAGPRKRNLSQEEGASK